MHKVKARFSAEDVVVKLNGRMNLGAAKDATDFLMLEIHIQTTTEDDHYKAV